MTIVNKDFVMELANEADEPCVSIYLSTEAAREGNFHKVEIKLKNHLSKTAKKLENEWGFKSSEVDEFLQPAYELINDINFLHHHEIGLVLFISKNKFEYLRFNHSVNDQVSVSKHFYIIPLLNQLMLNSQYYILALSKHSNKFYKANSDNITRLKKYEVEESLDDYVDYEGENTNIQHHSHKVSASNTVYHGRGIVMEEEKEDLLKYLRRIDKSIKNELKNKEVPLLLYCDEGLFHHYKKVNSYNNLFDKFINGNPENLKMSEIHEKTWESLKEYIQNQKEEIIEEFMELKGTSKTSLDIKLIIPDALYSKVYSLLIDGSKKLQGYFDIQNKEVHLLKNGNETYGLFNYAAILTLRNGGDVYVFDEEVPDGVNIEAINRY
ncbi:MAG TPA: hypothetical protein VJ907_08055 [Halanaerobiales bacterium]|nr:hypothetical protein [Halanaerobiales bacterium]